ncbi:hypothetical protein PROFUN_14587, partial [Planoprotostelium fungivorum]
LAHGNITEEQAVTTVNEIKNIFAGVPMSDSEFHEDRIVRLERGKEYVYSSPIPNPNESNSAVYVYYQIGLENRREDALLDVLNQIFDSTFYDQLRTKEQLGYIVWSGSRSHSNVQGFKIEVQSSKFTPKYLGERIEACLQLCKTTLDNLTEEEFNKVVSVVVSFKREKTKRLEEETSRMWGEINTHDYLFVRDELEVEELQKLKLEELREFFHHHIFHTQTRAKMTVERSLTPSSDPPSTIDPAATERATETTKQPDGSSKTPPSQKKPPEPPAEAVVEGKEQPQVDLEEMDRSQFEHRLNHLVSRATEMQRRDGRSAVSSEALTKMNVFPKDRTKDMNLDGAYLRDGSNFRNQREFVQNFVDQCRLLNQGLEPRMMFEQIPSQLTNTDGLNVWRLYDSASQVSRNSRQLLNFLQILGSIYETIVAGVPVHTSLNNYNTVLDPVILAMGRSEKGLSSVVSKLTVAGAGAAGHFGEGMKVTINRFTDAGYLVYYHTGCAQWSFSYDENRILHARFDYIEPRPHTTVTIQVPHHIFHVGANLKPIDINEYLTLNPYYQATCHLFWFDKNIILIPIEKITSQRQSHVIPGQGPEMMAGCIYVRGIQVTKSRHGAATGTSSGFAINFIGSTDQYEAIGLRRDRDHIKADRVVQMMRGLLTVGYQDNRTAQDEICRFILQHVEAQPPHDSHPEFVTALRVSYYHFLLGMTPESMFLDTLCDVRAALQTGEAAVLPHTKSQEKEKEEAEYLQYKTYLISDVMYSFIEPSRHMVTLEKLWAIKREDLWKLPDGVTKNEAETRVVQGLIETLRKCFTHSSEEEFHVFFKVFPRGNHLLVIDIPHTDVQGKPIFGRKPRSWVIDFQYLSRTEMHRWMEVHQATICTSDTCLCVRKQMVATFLEILQKRGIQMGSILVNLLDKAVQETQDPADLPGTNRTPRRTPQKSSEPHRPASESRPNGSSGETVTVHQQEEQEKRTVEDLAKAEVDLNQLLSDTQKQSQSIDLAGNTPNVPFKKRIKHVWIEECEEQTKRHWIMGREGVHHEKDDVQGQAGLSRCTIECIANFKSIIYSLAKLFDYPRHKVHFFYEDREIIGFNQNTHLFYNLRYYEALHLKKSRGKAKCWWLVVFAHEVAHNVASGHNKQHEFVEEIILQEHIFKLFNRWDD